jgi:hypothetical protein
MKKSELTEYIKQAMSSKLKTENVEDGTNNVIDTISMDVPLFIRLLEYAREDAKTDMDLHNVTEKAISLSIDGGTLTMSDYNNITSNSETMNEMKNPTLTKIAGKIMAKFPKQGKYDAFEEFKKHIGKENLKSDEEKEVYAIIKDKENEDLAEVAIGEKKLTAAEKAKKVAEDLDIGHQDDEPDMLKGDVYRIMEYAQALYKMLDQFDRMPGEVDFPDWWQQKIHLAAEYMDKAKHYLEFEMKQPSIDNNMSALAESIAKRLKKSYIKK